jgi:hypothetical protein
MEGELDGTVGVFGTLEMELTGDTPISIDWSADFGPGGTLSGELEGDATVEVDLIGELDISYEVSFDAEKVEEPEGDE